MQKCLMWISCWWGGACWQGETALTHTGVETKQETDEILTAAQNIRSNKEGLALILLKFSGMVCCRQNACGANSDVKFQTITWEEIQTLATGCIEDCIDSGRASLYIGANVQLNGQTNINCADFCWCIQMRSYMLVSWEKMCSNTS